MSTLATYQEAARNYIASKDQSYIEEVARRAFENSTCIVHEAHALAVENISTACSLCGGADLHTDRHGDHELCKARSRRGLPTPKLTGAGCTCAACEKLGKRTTPSV